MSWKFLSKEEQEAFHKETFTNDLNYIRIMLVLCVFFYSVFGILDFFVVPYRFWEFFYIRFLIVNPLFIVGIILSWLPTFYRIHQEVLAFLYICAGAGIVVMLALEPTNFSYYGGLFLIFATGHTLTRIRWKLVTISSIIILIVFIIMTQIINTTRLSDILIYTFFYITFIVMASYGTYNFNTYRLDKFIQTYTLHGDKILLEKEIYEKLIEIEDANVVTIYSLAKIAESKDRYTGEHIDRVGEYSLRVAEALDEEYYIKNGYNKAEFLEAIELASTLHDIGKVSINENILLKPGRLTDEEMKLMKEHSRNGYNILNSIRERYSKNKFINMGLDICLYHHERWDGQGYPEGLIGQGIPLAARIVSVIDVYDALVSERPYKAAYSISKSLEIIQGEKEKMFDPHIVDVFMTFFKTS